METAVKTLLNELSDYGYRMVFASCHDGWLSYKTTTEDYSVNAEVNANIPNASFTALASPEHIFYYADHIEVYEHSSEKRTTLRNEGD